MTFRNVSVAVLALTIVACSDPQFPTGAGLDTTVPTIAGPTFDFVEGEYPTEEDYLAAGGSTAGQASGTPPTGAFNGDLTSWSSTGQVSFQYVNQADAALATSLINSTGDAINSGGDSYSYGSTIPMFSVVSKTLSSTISTNNNKCEITGKARLTASASLKLIKNPTNLTLVWSGSLDKSAPDITLPECPVEEETCSTDLFYANGDCNESGEPAEGGEGGGGGGGEGGGTPGCEWYVTITYESQDGGETWTEIRRFYWELCP